MDPEVAGGVMGEFYADFETQVSRLLVVEKGCRLRYSASYG